MGRLEEAIDSYDRAIRLDPDYAEAHYSKAVALQAQNRLAEALLSYDRAIRAKPDYADAYYYRASLLQKLNRFDDAIATLDQALALKPNFAEAHYNRGNALSAVKRWTEAIASYDRAIGLKPSFAEAHFNKGNAFVSLAQHAEALQSYDRAVALNPAYIEAHGNRAITLKNLKRFEEALRSFDRIIELKLGSASAHNNRGNALRELRRLDEAIQGYDRAIAINADYAEAHWNKGLCLLAHGRFEEGFPLYEYRKKIGAIGQKYPSYDRPLWLGRESIVGKTLFVHHELLLGDAIQFSRYIGILESQGAKVVVSAPNPLRHLLQGISPTIEIIAEDAQPDNFDYYCPLMSLPLAAGTTLANVPSNVPYLTADDGRVEKWKSRLGDRGIKIGICWRGSNTAVAEERTFPLAEFYRISRLPYVRLISLQKADEAEELLNLPAGMNVEVLGDDFDAGGDAFIDTAAVMKCLDLVITPDTAIAHMAGALGCPVWLALKWLPEWRWLLDRSDSPWYPTMSLFRQPLPGDWHSVFAEIEHQLTEMIKTTDIGVRTLGPAGDRQ